MVELTNFWQHVATTLFGIVVAGIGFWVTLGKNMATKEEVCDLIETKSPYLHDRQFIMERLNSNKEIQAAFSQALQRNTDVMNELKIQIATLTKTLEAIEYRIESK